MSTWQTILSLSVAAALVLATAVVRLLRIRSRQRLLTTCDRYFRDRKYDEAIRTLSNHLSRFPGDSNARSWLGAAYSYTSRDGEAARELSRSVAERPASWSRFLLACSLLRLGERTTAEKEFVLAIGEAPPDERSKLCFRWSSLAWRAGNLGLMSVGLRRILADEPDNVKALHALARLLAGAPDPGLRNGDLAVAYAQRACEIEAWSDWRTVSVLAAAHAQAGDFDKAIRFATKALQMAPANEQEERRGRLEQYERGEPFRFTTRRPIGDPTSPQPLAPSPQLTTPARRPGRA